MISKDLLKSEIIDLSKVVFGNTRVPSCSGKKLRLKPMEPQNSCFSLGQGETMHVVTCPTWAQDYPE